MTRRSAARLAAATVAAALALPAAAQAAALNPIKPCYVSVTQPIPGERDQTARETIDVAGSGFTPGALIDLTLDGVVERTVQADAAGNLPLQGVVSPYQRRGQGTFTLGAAGRGNPANAVSLPSRRVALSLDLRPAHARPADRVRFIGRGFTEQRAVWAHYLYKGRLRKTVRLVRRIRNPCGVFSVRRPQIPLKRPRLGRWRVQFDQRRRYSRRPDGVNVRVDIDVRRSFRPRSR